jgi:Spy/CpxP family protein refolding chaperone
MQMRKSLLIGMVIASLWAATGFVQPAWSQDRGGYARQHGLVSLIFRVASLTDAQKEQVKQFFQDERSTLQPLRTTLQGCRRQLNRDLLALSDTAPDLQCVTSTQASIAQVRVSTISQVLALLTQPQLAQVVAAQTQLSELRQQAQQVLKGNSSSPQ